MKDDLDLELRRKMMEIDKQNTIRIMGLLMYTVIGIFVLVSLSSCGAINDLCPRNTTHAGCNTIAGEEVAKPKTLDQKFNDLENKNRELENELGTWGTGFEEEIESIKTELDQENNEEIGKVNNRIDRLKEIIDNLINQIKNKKGKKKDD